MEKESVIVLDFGGQYNQLIARRVRECNVYCEVKPYTMSLEEIKKINPKGIIFTGGPNSVYDEKSPHYDKAIFELGIPILGICYGSQLMAWSLGGTVETAPTSEYGHTEVEVDTEDALFEGVSKTTVCWMSHTDYIAKAPQGFRVTAHTPVCPVAAMSCPERKLYATQFHPEVMHTAEGMKMLSNFVYKVCGCHGDWKMSSFVETTIAQLRERIGNGKVLCALSGGVDSSVAAVLLSKAIGKQLTCVFVDHGLLRKNEGDEVEAVFGPNGSYELNFIRVNAQQRYYEKLKGVTEPEAKRKIIGEEFIRVFEEEARKIAKIIGLSAIKYGDLSNQASKDYIFDIDRFTSFEGDTGPYILYTIVRIKSILAKYQEQGKSLENLCLEEAQGASEKDLMRQLCSFNAMMDSACEETAPHKICAYIYDLANAFNKFYHETKILAEEDQKKQAGWIALLKLTKEVLETCIDVLGFSAPDRM